MDSKKIIKISLNTLLFFALLLVASNAFAAESSKSANTWSFIGNASLADWIIRSVIVPLLIAVTSAFGVIKFMFKREKILYRNLKRPIMVIEPTNKSGKIPGTELETEKQLLRDNGFLNLSKDVSTFQTFNPGDNHCLVVLGYHKDMIGLDEILTKVKQNYIPMIVYTYGENANVFNKTDKDKFDAYPWVFYANFKQTLLNSIFSTLATFPYYKKDK